MQTAFASIPAIKDITDKQATQGEGGEPVTWEELFLFLFVADPIYRASHFLQVADAYNGEQIKTKQELVIASLLPDAYNNTEQLWRTK